MGVMRVSSRYNCRYQVFLGSFSRCFSNFDVLNVPNVLFPASLAQPVVFFVLALSVSDCEVHVVG